MKKTVIPVSFDAEKLSAAKLYMAQKELSFEDDSDLEELLKKLAGQDIFA